MEVGGWWLSPASGVSCGKPQTKLGPCVVCACLLLCVCICVCVCDFTFGRLFGRGSSVIAFLAIHVSLHLPSLHPPWSTMAAGAKVCHMTAIPSTRFPSNSTFLGGTGAAVSAAVVGFG